MLNLSNHGLSPFSRIPGHALHEKSLQRQKSVGPLVGSQEQRALLLPVITRLQTACQPVILFPHSVHIGFRLFVLMEFPGHPWDEKGLQRQKSVGLLVGIQ